jgi:hypothetical protein
MKTYYKLTLLLLLLGPLAAIAGPVKGKYTKTKTLSKTLALTATGNLEIDNSFGNITITTWDQDQVSFEIKVTVSGNDKDEVEERLQNIDVDFTSTTGSIRARTDTEGYEKKNSSWWSLLTGGNSNDNQNIKIDYIVKMPMTANLDVSNDYGAVVIDRLEGRALISCDFGRLDIGELMHADNVLKFDYTNNSTIDYMKSGTIKADFSDFTLLNAKKIDFNGDYTKAKFEKVNQLNFNSDFSTITTEETVVIDGRGDYSTLRIGNVSESINLNTDFGTIKIKELGPEFIFASISSDYTGITIGYHKDAAFKFDVLADFASINLSDDLQVTRSDNDTTEKRRSGYYNNASSSSFIEIKTEFGGATLRRSN